MVGKFVWLVSGWQIGALLLTLIFTWLKHSNVQNLSRFCSAAGSAAVAWK